MTKDYVSWHKTKSFSFTVRSAYHSEWEHQFGNRTRYANGQGSTGIKLVWNKVWKLKVPRKVKNLAWRALHGAI
jgi:hypothetical protein